MYHWWYWLQEHRLDRKGAEASKSSHHDSSRATQHANWAICCDEIMLMLWMCVWLSSDFEWTESIDKICKMSSVECEWAWTWRWFVGPKYTLYWTLCCVCSIWWWLPLTLCHISEELARFDVQILSKWKWKSGALRKYVSWVTHETAKALYTEAAYKIHINFRTYNERTHIVLLRNKYYFAYQRPNGVPLFTFFPFSKQKRTKRRIALCLFTDEISISFRQHRNAQRARCWCQHTESHQWKIDTS